MAAQGQLVDPVEEHRQALGRAEDIEEGIEADRGGALAKQPLADFVPGPDPQLFVGAPQQVLGTPAQPPGRGAG